MVDDDSTVLNQIAHDLTSVADKAEVRGHGSALFVFAESNARCIELCRSNEGWWVEFWEGDQVGTERTYTSRESAVQDGRDWLVQRERL
jgi:hypothetical protein